jgi:hypothetical protein
MSSKYDPLRRHLMGTAGDRIRLSFTEIESILRFSLPSSARRYAPWWANTSGSHIQADAWTSAGWRTAQVDVGGERVTFERSVTERSPAASEPAPQGGMQDTGASFARDDAIVVSKAALRGSAVRLLEDYCEAHGGNLGDAVAATLNGLVLERRRQLLKRFPKTGAPSPVDSAELIRRDRDAR